MPKRNILTHSRKKKAFALLQAKQFEQAKDLYVQVCEADKLDADAWFSLGAIHGMLGRHADAADCLRRAVQLRPRHAESSYNLGISLREQGNFTGAIEAFQAALEIKPDYAEAQDCLAHALLGLGRLEEAVEAFRAALRFYPGKPELHSNLGSVYQAMGRLAQAEACYREAQRLKPAIACENLGSVLGLQGRHEEALACYREGLRFNPRDERVRSNLLLTLNYLPNQDPETILREHRAWDTAHACSGASMRTHANSRDPARRLRIGYVSQDLRTHSVAYYIEPLLKTHDRTNFEVYCYAHVSRPDATTEWLRSYADCWRDISKLSDEQVAGQVRADGIDILVDLSGHTGGHRLSIFSRKPAPLQVTYLGYPNTTGLSTMDYRLTDALADPEGQERFYTEELVRLPGCFLCYLPPADAPAVTSPPSDEAGFVTFGSFNNLAKINVQVIELWSEVLRGVPKSRLLLKNHSLTDADTREKYHAMFVKHGITRDRLELTGHTPTREGHLALYGRVDIALDTFPYNGTTTTCEALWMGVPVITLAGKTHAGRVGLSLLTVLGLNEFIADGPQGYVARATTLANDREQLTHLRTILRERMRASPLCDAPAFARKVEAAYREMWRRWCQG